MYESKIVTSAYPDHPQVAVGAIVFKDDRVLLVRRGKAPALGMWAIPGGSVNLGETLCEAAEREILEETSIVIRAREPILTFDVVKKDEQGKVRFHYVIIDLSADYLKGEPRAGDDALDARWVSASEMKDLPVVPRTLTFFWEQFRFGGV